MPRAGGGPLKIDAFKLSHHGSKGTHSVELMKHFESKRFLISTNGSRHQHPDLEALARTVKHGGDGAELVFNYSSEFTDKWDTQRLKNKYGYTTAFPDNNTPGVIRVNL